MSGRLQIIHLGETRQEYRVERLAQRAKMPMQLEKKNEIKTD